MGDKDHASVSYGSQVSDFQPLVGLCPEGAAAFKKTPSVGLPRCQPGRRECKGRSCVIKYVSTLEEKAAEMGSVFPLTLVRRCLDLNQCNRKHGAGPAGWHKSRCPSLVTAAWEVDVKHEQATQRGQGNHGCSQQELQVSPFCLHHPTLSQLSCSGQSSTPAKPAADSDCWRPLTL